MSEDIWLECVRLRLRFPSSKGNLSVEDLFMLGLSDLNSIYEDLSSKSQSKGKSLMGVVSEDEFLLNKKLDIVENVYHIKEAELIKQENELMRSRKKERIRELIYKKEDDALSELSVDELKELLDEI